MAINVIKYGGHAVAESTKLSATNYGEHIFNVKLTQDMDNGSLVSLTQMEYLAPEYYSMVAPAKGDKVGLVLQTPLIYEEFSTRVQGEDNFYNEKGDIVRVYDLKDGDIFSVSEIGITAASSKPQVGGFIVADGFGLKEQVTEPTDTGFYGEIIGIVKRSNLTMYKIEVKANEAKASA